jgi:protein translocase SecG subunit
MESSLFNIIQIILSTLLVIVVLLQQKSSGVGGVFGGSSNVYSTKRGVDKILFYATIVIAVLFFGFSMMRLFF